MLDYALRDGVAVLHLDDGRVNAVNHTFIDHMNEALDQAVRDDVRAIVVAGREGVLSGGFDLSVMQDASLDEKLELANRGARMLLRLFESERPIVAACTGHGVAAGGFILLTCDRAIGAEGNFKVGVNEGALGMTFPMRFIELAKAKLDPRRLSEAVLHGVLYSPEDAVSVGFLDEIVPLDQVVDRAVEWARLLGALPREAYIANKQELYADALSAIRGAFAGVTGALNREGMQG